MLMRNALEKRSSSLNQVGINDKEFLDWLGITPGEVNMRGKNALKEATVFACIRILAESIAKLPIKIYQQDENSITRVSKHYLSDLLQLRPNPYMSASDYSKCLEVQRNLYGNAYVAPEYDPKTGRIIGLWPIDATRVTIWVDNIGLLNSKNKIWYVIEAGNETIRLWPDEILHFKSGVTLDGIVGIAPLDYLRATAENAASASKFVNNFYKQGLQTKGIIQYVGDLNEEAKRTFREKFEEMSAGLKNSHRISLMPIGYQFQPLSLSMADAQFLENTQLTIRQLASAFGIKMHQLNDLDRATWANVAEQQKQFYVETLQPILIMYEQENTYKLFLPREIRKGYYLLHNVDAILRADIQTRYSAYRTGIQSGMLKPNEARAKEDLPPDPDGDQLLINGNMLPIGKAGTQYAKKGGDGTGQAKDGQQGDPGATGVD